MHNHCAIVHTHFQTKDPVIYDTLKTMDFSKWFVPQKKKISRVEYFQSLCRQIISQQLSGKAADTIQGQFETLFSDRKITPETLLKIEDQTLRDAGMSWAKVSYVKNIAKEILGSNTSWEDFFDNLEDENVVAELNELPRSKQRGILLVIPHLMRDPDWTPAFAGMTIAPQAAGN